MENPERVCRLCFKTYNNIEGKEGITKEIFDVLLPKINLAVNDDPCVCTRCIENVKKCFDFKSTCLYTQECVHPFYDNKDNGKVDLKDLIYLNRSNDDGISTEDYDVCGFCMVPIKDYSFISLDYENEDLTLEKIMLEKCLPELDLSIIEKPVICASCHGSLHSYFGFVTNVEENMERHCKVANVNTEAKVDNFVQFTSQNILESKENKSSGIKMEENIDEEAVENGNENMQTEYQNCNKTAQISEDHKLTCKEESDIIKVKEEICGEAQNSNEEFDCDGKYFVKIEDQKFNDFFQVTTNVSTYKKVELEDENLMGMDNQKCSPCGNKEIKIKPDQVDFDSSQELFVEYEMANDPSEISTIETRPEKYMNQQQVTTFKCEICSYETRHKRNLKRHLLTHKSPTDINMFQCKTCSFHTIRKSHLKHHLLIHKTPSEVTVFKCEMCTYETKRKSNLKQHSLCHKSPSDINMFKCEMCSFSTKRKHNFNIHVLTHKSASEVTMFKCEFCPHQTKHKQYLKQHLETHKTPSDISMFKCETCSYQTRRKCHLKTHLLIHKSLSEVTLFKCEMCPYETKRKSHLKQHSLKHKSLSEVTLFKCEMCVYETRHKYNLKQHSLSHKSLSDVNMFACEMCPFSTKRKYYLKVHLLTHKSLSGVTLFKCEMCAYKTKYKGNLKQHTLTHKSPTQL